jgi:hypothetical protein
MKATKVDERAIPAAGHRSSSVPLHRPEGSAKFGKKIDAPNSLSLSPLRLAYSVPLLPADCPEVDAAVDTEDIDDSLEYKSPGAVGRGLSNWHNRNILMEELGLHDENELVNWLRKSWVIDAYGEYAEAFLNPTRLEEKAVQAKGPRIFRKYFSRGNNYSSTAEYVINSSISALKGSGSSPFQNPEAKDNWGDAQHHIWFLVQLVSGGRASGHWTMDLDAQTLCIKAYRVAAWLRHIPRANTSTGQIGELHMEHRDRWVQLLRDAYFHRTRQSTERKKMDAVIETSSPRVSRDTNVKGHFRLSSIERGKSDRDGIEKRDRPSMDTATRTSSPRISRDITIKDQSRASSIERGESEGDGMKKRGRPSQPSLTGSSPFPSQATSKDELTRGLSWLTLAAKETFENHQRLLLSRWGVAVEHDTTCVQVPSIWENVDPRALMASANPEGGLGPGINPRLQFSYRGYATVFTRASLWFSRTQWPPAEAELEEFAPSSIQARSNSRTASHICHHGFCINPHHVVFEDLTLNLSRNSCVTAAATLRRYSAPIPPYCSTHEPPCLLQVSLLCCCICVQRCADPKQASRIDRPGEFPYSVLCHVHCLHTRSARADKAPVPRILYLRIQASPVHAVRMQGPVWHYGRFCPYYARISSPFAERLPACSLLRPLPPGNAENLLTRYVCMVSHPENPW